MEDKQPQIVIVGGGKTGLSAMELEMLYKKCGNDCIIIDPENPPENLSPEVLEAIKKHFNSDTLSSSPSLRIEAMPTINIPYLDDDSRKKPSPEQRRNWNKQNHKKK